MSITLTINDKLIQAQENQTVLEVGRANGIIIPTLCYHKDLSPVGSCRLCVVEVGNLKGQVAACTLLVANGMVVHTDTQSLIQARRTILSMLLQNYSDSGYTLHGGNDTEFEHWLRTYGVPLPKGNDVAARYPVNSDSNPFVWVDFNKCILCTRCVRACEEIQGRFVWGVGGRGGNSRIIAGADTTMLEARCESCGACVVYCPTGALDHKLSIMEGEPDQKVTTTCTYCGVGCQFDLNVKNGKVIGVSSNPNAPVNQLHLCVKGRYGYDFIHHPDRLIRPKVRRYLIEGSEKVFNGPLWDWVETDWSTALNITAGKLNETLGKFGSSSIGILTSAKCLNEETYLMNKLARQVLGTNNIDHCARLCHSSTVVGLTASFGSGAMSNSMDDIVDKAAAIFIIGSNTTEQHPVFGSRLRQAVLRRGAKLVVADPRRVDIVDYAKPSLGGLYLRNRPGTDIALINGMMHIILKNGWEDKSFIASRTEGFEELTTTIEHYSPQEVSSITGVPVENIYRATEILALNKPMSVIWAMGITQHIVGVQNVMNLANLQMLLGNMGVEGGGVNPLRGQNNVQGACDMGGLPNVFSGYQSVTSLETRQKFEAAWGIPMPDKVGLTTTEMVSATEDGTIRALYILGEDPVMSDPNTGHIRRCLEKCEFLVLQEIFPSETSRYADVMLPGVSFAEKTGTFTNTERRVQLCRKAINPMGDSMPDWRITKEIAKRIINIGNREIKPTSYSEWNYMDTSAVMSEIAAVTPSYAGISFDRLEAGERLQWPVKGLDHSGTPILHIGQFTRGKGKFESIEHVPPAELPDSEFPILLSTGRVLYHWHGGQMTRRAKGLMGVYDRALVEINPDDAAKWHARDGSRLRVTSRRGSIEVHVWITDRVSPGMIYANFHFPGASANELTHASLDPVAKIPEYKISAVRVEVINDIPV